jgi:hypothetical protein
VCDSNAKSSPSTSGVPAAGLSRSADQPQQCPPVHKARQLAAEPGTGAAAPARARLLAALCAGHRSAGYSRWSGWHLLSERDLRARLIGADEAAGPQDGQHFLAAAWGIGTIAAGNGCAPAATAHHIPGTPPRWHRSRHMHRLADRDDFLDDQARQVEANTVRASRSHAWHDHKHDDHDATGRRADRLTENGPEPSQLGR